MKDTRERDREWVVKMRQRYKERLYLKLSSSSSEREESKREKVDLRVTS